MNEGYIKSLDGVRALAILLVMTFHAEITHFGWLGVQLFFVLSGFLITGILWKEKSRPEPVSFKFKKFWVRRSLRIFPLYYAYLIVWTLTWLALDFPGYYETYAPYLFTYTFNYIRTMPEWLGNPLFTHLWSLSVEEQFYLVFPFIIFLLPARAIKYLLIAVAILSPVIRYLLGELYLQQGVTAEVAADAVYWNTLSHLDAFFLGGLIPVLSLDQKIKRPKVFLMVTLALVVLVGWLNYQNTPGGEGYVADLGYSHKQADHMEYVWQYTLLNLLFVSFILTVLSVRKSGSSLLRKFLETSWLVNIGKVSYGMYIFHWLVLVYIFRNFFNTDNTWLRIGLFIPYVAVVYFISYLSFRLFESKFLVLKDRFFKTSSANRKVQQSGSNSVEEEKDQQKFTM
jgi:peptidoglycan/LPS O-acetylase OafA/YrhL